MEVADGQLQNERHQSRSDIPLRLSSVSIPASLSVHSFRVADGKGMTWFACMSNFVLSIVGTSVLGVANSMAKGGWILPVICAAVGTSVIYETTNLVSDTVDKLVAEGAEVRAYADFAGAALGPYARTIAAVSSSLSLLGMICGGMVVITSCLQYAYAFPFDIEWPIPLLGSSCSTKKDDIKANGMAWYAFFASFLTLFYTLVPLGELLNKTAMLGPIVCILCVILAWWGAGSAVADLGDFPVACRDTPVKPYWSIGPPSNENNFFGWLWDCASITFDLASYNVYNFAVVVTAPSLKMQMVNAREFVSAAGSAYVICFATFLTIMLLEYWGCGSYIPENIIDAMKQNRPDNWFAMPKPWEQGDGTNVGRFFAWMVIFNLIVTDGIYVPVAALSLASMFPESWSRTPHFKKFIGVFVTLFRLIVATSITSFITLNKLTSSLFCVTNNILLPILAFHATKPRLVSTTTKIRHGIMFIFGIGILSVGTYRSTIDFMDGGSCASASSENLRPKLTEACLGLLHGSNNTTVDFELLMSDSVRFS
eukprot:TRINITY_DN10546_c0_g1_i1.p1 TRINITY_DN10546_c0_g1~~TRINITY_DN10546_c0_g1_i1.p1  ORF type:complete len:554 (+),score=67.01 TRINITY_DN10546_c0_g1_i1:46-1662(+)